MIVIGVRHICRVTVLAHFTRATFAGFCAAILLSTGFFTRAHAGVNVFSSLGPEGSYAQAVAYHPTDPNIAYLGTASGFYRSTDGGSSWDPVSGAVPNGVRDIAVNPSDPTRIFVGGFGIFVSEDSGASVLQLSTLGNTNVLNQVEYSADGSTLYVVDTTRLMRSMDDGHTWTQGGLITTPTAYTYVLRADPRTPGVLYAGTSEGAFRSTDDGATWTPLNVPGSNDVIDIAVSRSTPQRIWTALSSGLWFSDDAGLNWTQAISSSANFVFVDRDNDSVVYASSFNTGLIRSSDGGATWTSIHGNALVGIPQAIAQGPGSNQHLLLAGSEGVVGTNDGGANWTYRNSGVQAPSLYELAASPLSDRIYVSAIQGGLHVVEGDGPVVPVNNESLRQFSHYGLSVETRGLFVHPAQPDRLLVGVPRGIARSEDGGETWQLLSNAAFSSSPIVRIVAGSADGQVLVAAGAYSLFRSTNGGDTWSTVTGPTFAQVTEGFAAAPSNPSVLYLGVLEQINGPSRILKSVDAGVTWTPTAPLPSGSPAEIVVDPRNDGVVYVATNVSLLRSTDGGNSWSEVMWAPVNRLATAFAIDPVDPDILYATNSERISRSVDAGQIWELLPGPSEFPFWDIRAMSVDALRPHRLLVAANSKGLQQIDIEPDLSIIGQATNSTIGYGRPTTVTYTVRNSGPFDATNFRTTIGLSSTATDVVATASNGTCSRSATDVVCSGRVLRVGATATITVTFAEPAAGSFRIPAVLEAAQPDLDATDNTTSVDVTVAEVADVSVAATGPANVTDGGTGAYVLTVTNAGPNDASAVRVTFQPAAGLSIASVTPSKGSCESSGSGPVTCTIGALAASASATVSIVSGALAVGTFESTFGISNEGVDLTTGNNSGTITTTATSPPPPQGGGSGGGGGNTSLWMVFALLGLSMARGRKTFAGSGPLLTRVRLRTAS